MTSLLPRTDGLRARLVLLFLALTVPGLLFLLLYAWSVFVTQRAGNTEVRTQRTRAVALRYQGVIEGARRLADEAASLARTGLLDRSCEVTLTGLLAAREEVRSLSVTRPDGTACRAGVPGGDEALPPGQARAGTAEFGPVITVAGSGPERAVAVVAPAAFTRAGELLAPAGREVYALLGPGAGILAAQAGPKVAGDWTSAGMPSGGTLEQPSTNLSEARNGLMYDYYSAEIAGPDLRVVTAFHCPRFGPTEQRLLVAVVVPLALMAVVGAAVWVGLDRLVLAWAANLRGLSLRYAAGDYAARSDAGPETPSELRELDLAFNAMAANIEERTAAQARAIHDKDEALRELNHRVKNNFQVLSSFIRIMKRGRAGETMELLTLAECRMHAMAAPYRLALHEGEIGGISAGDLLADVADFVARARAPGLAFHGIAREGDRQVDLDQALSLALLSTEVMWALGEGVGEGAEVGVDVAMVPSSDPDEVHVRFVPREPLKRPLDVGRFGRAFVGQLEARQAVTTEPGIALDLTFPTRRTVH